jgi:hypothetical protein
MKGVLERLNYVWDALLGTELVQDPNATADSQISEFAKILNKSTPVTPAERAAHETVRYIYTMGRHDFVRMVIAHSMPGLLLACDGTSIANELGITSRVDIRWIVNTSEYSVCRAGTRGDVGHADYTNAAELFIGSATSDNNHRPQDRKPREDYRQERKPREDYRQERKPREDYRQERKPREDYRQERKPREDNNRQERKPRDRNEINNNERNQPLGKKKYEPKGGKKVKSSAAVPPISTQDQIEILKQLQSIKTYAGAAQSNDNIPITSADTSVVSATTASSNTSVNTQHAASTTTASTTASTTAVATPTEVVTITNEDIRAISAAIGGNI